MSHRWVRISLFLVLSLTSLVLVHDGYCSVSFGMGVLCRRPDDTLWRDPSAGCTGGEDPNCRDGRQNCADSERLSEDWRHSCNWILQRREISPTGEPPFHEGPSPGSGKPGRL